VLAVADQLKDGQSAFINNDRLAVDEARLDGEVSDGSIRGKRSAKLYPFLVNSRTPLASLRASMRKPSCLISWSQP
jgi:hypothetical protein